MKMAFIMNPLEGVKPYKDTSYFLMLAARERGHTVFYLDQRDLSVRHDKVIGRVIEVDVHDDHAQPFTPSPRRDMNMAEMDVIWIRTDPPLDRTYLYTTLLLDLLPASTRVVNRPSGIRNWNEKLTALFFPNLIPETLISNNTGEIKAFIARHDRATLKPIDGHGGEGIVFLSPGDKDQDEHINGKTQNGSHWIIVQEYLPAARDGDKRILLLNGEPLGAALRVHAEGEELNNLDAGATAQPSELNERDLEICDALKPGLIEQGIFFAGIDVIGGKLIEVNVTSPTVLQELSRFNDQPYHHQIIQALEE